MGRRSRHSAKTGDQSIYKSRSKLEEDNEQHDDDDDDPMYDEVDRHHRRRVGADAEEEYLELDGDDGDGSSSDEDDGITTRQEGVFDLGIGGSSDEDDEDDDKEEDDDDDDSGDSEEGGRETRRAAASTESALAGSSSDDDSDSDSDEEGDGEKSRLLNWGDKKHSYYHGDTADLEIGQDVEDAYLEEEAGREVERARMDDLDDADFFPGGDDDGDGARAKGDDDGDEDEEGGSSKKKPRKRRKAKDDAAAAREEEGEETTIVKRSVRRRRLSQLSRKEKVKVLKADHPELLPLVRHFAVPVRELQDTTMVAAGALLKKGVRRGGTEAEAVGATTAGLQYLIAKSMLQASQALNLSLYLLLKADQASKNNGADDDDDGGADDIRSHPVMDRLNQLSQLTDRLREGVEDKVPGLGDQVSSLVKAAALMDGGDLSSSEDDSESDGEGEETDSSELRGDARIAAEASDQTASDAEGDDDADAADAAGSSSESEDDEKRAQEAARRRIMTEAKFALRNQDVDRDAKNAKKRKRRLAPPLASSDYGDETEEVTDRAVAAGRSLASTMNSIVQKSSTSDAKKKRSAGGEEDGDDEDEYGRMQKGLSMMEEQFGKGSDDDASGDEEGFNDSEDEDDFYKSIKSKSRAKKEAKKQMYAVAPKYPRLEGVVEGERAIGKTIMKNRGLVAHKAKINRNPRVKKREQYRKALIRRKGAVREVRTEEGHAYGGENTGIKSGISRSRKLGR